MTRRLLVAIGILSGAIGILRAAAPKVDALYPNGGRRGGTVAPVLLIGKLNDWPLKAWCSHPGILAEPEEKKNRLRVTVGGKVPPGAYLLRVYNDHGASTAKTFVVSDEAEVLEYGLNENLEKPEEVKSLPLVINGRLERRGDTDFYRVKLKAGQLFTARLDGYSLGSLIDPFLNLYDPRGYEIAVASDTHNLDPYLQHRITRDGDYQVQVFAITHKASTSVGYAGAPAAVYRLRLTTDPDERLGLPIKADVSEDAAGKLRVPARVAGVVARSGEQDDFVLTAKKGDQITVRVEARRWRYLWDPVLVVRRPDGRVLRTVDDIKPTADAVYTFKASQDGDHKITVADRFRTGGPEHRYRLVVESAQPSVEATIDKDRFELKPGKTVDLKLKLDRSNGHKAALNARVEGLPPGVSLEAGPIDGKAKTATLKLKAAADAGAFTGPIRIHLAADEGVAIPVNHSFVTGDSRGDYLVNETPHLWLTVLKPAKTASKK